MAIFCAILEPSGRHLRAQEGDWGNSEEAVEASEGGSRGGGGWPRSLLRGAAHAGFVEPANVVLGEGGLDEQRVWQTGFQ